MIIFASVASHKCNNDEAKLPLTEFRQSLSLFCTTKPTNNLLTVSTESFPPLSEEIVNFTGGLAFSAPGKMYLTGVEGRPRYVGEASDEVDENWKLLVDGSTILLSIVVWNEADSNVDANSAAS